MKKIIFCLAALLLICAPAIAAEILPGNYKFTPESITCDGQKLSLPENSPGRQFEIVQRIDGNKFQMIADKMPVSDNHPDFPGCKLGRGTFCGVIEYEGDPSVVVMHAQEAQIQCIDPAQEAIPKPLPPEMSQPERISFAQAADGTLQFISDLSRPGSRSPCPRGTRQEITTMTRSPLE